MTFDKMNLRDFETDQTDFFNDLSKYFFEDRCQEASSNGWLGSSTWRAFNGTPKKYKGQIKEGLLAAGETVKTYISQSGKQWTSISDFDREHKHMLELFKAKLSQSDVGCSSEGTYLKALNICIWHYVLGRGDNSNSSVRSEVEHLKPFLHPSFDGDVLRGIMGTIRESNLSTCPMKTGWRKGNSSGWIKSYFDYFNLLTWVRNILEPHPAIILERFWRMEGCQKP